MLVGGRTGDKRNNNNNNNNVAGRRCTRVALHCVATSVCAGCEERRKEKQKKGEKGEKEAQRAANTNAHRRFPIPYRQIAIYSPSCLRPSYPGAQRRRDSFVSAFCVINYDQACETIRIRCFSAKQATDHNYSTNHNRWSVRES